MIQRRHKPQSQKHRQFWFCIRFKNFEADHGSDGRSVSGHRSACLASSDELERWEARYEKLAVQDPPDREAREHNQTPEALMQKRAIQHCGC